MKWIHLLFFVLFIPNLLAQEPQLAYQYFRNGEYEKAATLFESLRKNNPYNTNYTSYLIDCYQQLENYQKSKSLIENQLALFPNQEYLYVDLGYNYQLQYKKDSANYYYELAKASLSKNKGANSYLVAKSFQDNHLLDEALFAYEKAMEINPSANYNYQIASLYGEKGEIEKMFSTYITLAEKNKNYLPNIKIYLGRYITNDPSNNYNALLKKLLLLKSQNEPNDSYNILLSWLFVQEKNYFLALLQEKALYKRNDGSLKPIIDLGKIAFTDNDYTTAKNSFTYILESTDKEEAILLGKLYLLEIAIKEKEDPEVVESKFDEIFNQYGKNVKTLAIQNSYAQFLAFEKKSPEKAIDELEKTLKLPLNEYEKGTIKITLGDILVFTDKFNTALIYYTQVQQDLKNHIIGQQAKFKIAQTSYFKGDFKWAQSQLNVLKNSTSQLIANDALDLNLLIADNAVKDSLKLALKKYAKAELFMLQRKNEIAIDTLQFIIENYKGHPIEDEALFKQAQLFEAMNNYEKAEDNYLKIINLDSNDILVDDALYALASLYETNIENKELAKKYYETILFKYPSSIYLVDARKKYRALRGDTIEN